jgi:hypothetical protein
MLMGYDVKYRIGGTDAKAAGHGRPGPLESVVAGAGPLPAATGQGAASTAQMIEFMETMLQFAYRILP